MAKAFTLRNGLILLSTEAPGGIYNSAQLKKVSALCDENTAIVKATEDQRLALFVKPENAEKVAKELKAVGLGVRNYQDGLHQPVNCVGNLCPDNLQDALSTSMELQKELTTLQLSSSLRIGINGCFRACVPTHTLDVSLIGDTNGYRISLGGKNSQLPEMACFMAENVPAAEIPRLIKKIILIYQEQMTEDESLQDVMDRVGSSDFIKALHPYSQDAAGADDPFGGFSEDTSVEDSPLEGAADAENDELSFENLGEELVGDDPGFDQLSGDDLQIDSFEAEPAADLDMSMETSDDLTENFGSVDIDPSLDDANAILDGDVAISDDTPFEMSDDIDFSSDSDVAGIDGIEISESEIAGDIGELTGELLESDPDLEGLEMMEIGDEPVVGDDLPMDESGNTLEANEIDESEADAFEDKLNASIEEEESMPQMEDENSESRMAAVRLVEAAGVDETPAVPSDEDSDFGNLEIERDAPDFGDDDIDSIDLAPEIFDEDIESPHPVGRSSGSGSDVCGIDFLNSGKVALLFENGAKVTFAPDSLSAGRREIRVGGKPIGIALTSGGVSIEVDGLSVFYPKAAA